MFVAGSSQVYSFAKYLVDYIKNSQFTNSFRGRQSSTDLIEVHRKLKI